MAAPKPTRSSRLFAPDDRQREASEHVHGPMLVVAGAGTGKTTVLTQRIAQLIRKGHARPDEILAVTYTDNAAREMRGRVQAEVAGSLSGLQVETFHAYCNNLLIRNGKKFEVLDDVDLWIYLRKRIRELQLNYFVRAANVGKFLHDLLDFMRRCQDELVEPEKYAEYVNRLERGELPVPRVCKSKDAGSLTDDEVLGRCREIAGVVARVEKMLASENFGTFGHMITGAYQLLRQDADLLARERQRARFILVDEFQDANFAQVKIVRLLAGDERNVFAVGDPDQAIYRFRGASSAAFALFQHSFPEARVVALEKNRRSTTPILQCAYALISKNPPVFCHGKNPILGYQRSPLISAREEDANREGQRLESLPVDAVILGPKEKDLECADVITVIRERRQRAKCKWSNFAVLYRQHDHRDALVAEMIQQGIPFSIENMDVMDTPEARDLFACLGALVSEFDDASLLRVAALPEFAIDPEALRAGIRALPREQEKAAVATVLRQIENGSAVIEALRQVREEVASTYAKGRAIIEIIIRRFGFDRTAPPLAAVLEFVTKWEQKPITKSGEAAELLEYLDYLKEARGSIPMPSTEADAVRLMTAHSAKGLEFGHTFVLRANSPSFPCGFKESLVEFPRELRDPDSVAEQDDKALHDQEERRLFYVAMTRARDSLTIYALRGRGKNDPTPPGFLRELLKDTGLKKHLRQRRPRGFQTDLFAQAAANAPAPTRIATWIDMPPASDLSARLSASALQSYETCPLQFKLEREWRIPGEVPAAMQYGGTMHRILRHYYESVRFGRTMSEETLLELFQLDLSQANIPDRYQHELYLRQGIDQLKEFLAICHCQPAPDVLHTEEFFEVRIGETAVAGRIDRMDRLPDGRVAITDYKTGKAQAQEDADKSLQLSIYALAAREKWGYCADRLMFYNLVDNSSVMTARDDGQLQEAALKVQEVAVDIAAGKFDPTPGFHCNFCAYRSLCPATEKRLSSISCSTK